MLEAEGVSKVFPLTVGLFRRRVGEVRAVDGVALSIRAGETLALVGESGSGKTTLAKVLIRLLPPTAGVIRFDGRELTRLSERALRPVRRQSMGS